MYLHYCYYNSTIAVALFAVPTSILGSGFVEELPRIHQNRGEWQELQQVALKQEDHAGHTQSIVETSANNGQTKPDPLVSSNSTANNSGMQLRSRHNSARFQAHPLVERGDGEEPIEMEEKEFEEPLLDNEERPIAFENPTVPEGKKKTKSNFFTCEFTCAHCKGANVVQFANLHINTTNK